MNLYAAEGGIAACRQRKPNNLASLVEMHPYPRLRRYFSTGKHVTGFSGRFTPLQIQFLCHPEGGSFSGAMLCAA